MCMSPYVYDAYKPSAGSQARERALGLRVSICEMQVMTAGLLAFSKDDVVKRGVRYCFREPVGSQQVTPC